MTNRILPIFGAGGPSPSEFYTKAEIDAMLANYAQLVTTDLVNYYLKSETYTQAEIQNLVGQITSFEVVATLPVSDIKTNVIYLLGPTGSGADRYEEYIYSNSTWTKIGETSVDLSNYITVNQLNTALGFYTPTVQMQGMLDGKQDVLTAGEGITIGTDGTISADIPTLATVATSGSYNDLTDKPSIPVVPTLATVATSGSYNDLTDKPNIPIIPTLATVATTGDYSDLTGTPALSTVATTGDYNDLTNKPNIPVVPTLATVATTGDYDDLTNKPTIPDAVSGTNDGTNWTSMTIGTETYDIPQGGGSGNEWYGSQYQFDTLGTYYPDTDYYISEISYSEIKGTPNLSVYETKADSQAADQALDTKIAGKMDPIVFLGTAGLPSIGTPLEGVTYAIEGETLPLTFTLADQSTVTYNFVID